MKRFTIIIDVVPPYDFFASTHSHRYKKYHFDQYERSDGKYKKAYEFDNKLLLAEMVSEGTVKKPRLSVSLIGNSINERMVDSVRTQIQRQFLTSTDLKPFYKHCSNDKILAGLTNQYFGLKPNYPGDLFECVTRCIISQQINVTFADKVEMSYVQKFGKRFVHRGESFYVYPDAKSASEIKKKDLLKIQFSERKAEYLIDLARDVVNGTVDIQKIESLPAEAFRKEITKIRGIGMWTAECCLMHLGHRDILPRGDVGLHQAIRRFYNINKNASPAKVLKIADKWQGWESFATYYLWHALTNERMKKPDA
ncbi:DNA-3-methyladenine glycosylase 2 family protein [bacterium]|nr:DNA-3-methyladenine glycosylase 2 family protein [bacterium]